MQTKRVRYHFQSPNGGKIPSSGNTLVVRMQQNNKKMVRKRNLAVLCINSGSTIPLLEDIPCQNKSTDQELPCEFSLWLML